MVILWIVTAICAAVGATDLMMAATSTASAPQQGALAAMGAASAVIPYVFTRACESIANSKARARAAVPENSSTAAAGGDARARLP